MDKLILFISLLFFNSCRMPSELIVKNESKQPIEFDVFIINDHYNNGTYLLLPNERKSIVFGLYPDWKANNDSIYSHYIKEIRIAKTKQSFKSKKQINEIFKQAKIKCKKKKLTISIKDY